MQISLVSLELRALNICLHRKNSCTKTTIISHWCTCECISYAVQIELVIECESSSWNFVYWSIRGQRMEWWYSMEFIRLMHFIWKLARAHNWMPLSTGHHKESFIAIDCYACNTSIFVFIKKFIFVSAPSFIVCMYACVRFDRHFFIETKLSKCIDNMTHHFSGLQTCHLIDCSRGEKMCTKDANIELDV